jgi:hypothetical protein
MIRLPDGMGRFEFSVTASQRALQLVRGCVPRVRGEDKAAMTALLEVAAGRVRALPSCWKGADGRCAPCRKTRRQTASMMLGSRSGVTCAISRTAPAAADRRSMSMR